MGASAQLRFLHVVFVLLVVVSGCVGNPSETSDGPSTSIEDSPPTRLEVQSNADANLTVTLVDVRGEPDETVFQREYPPGYDSIDVSEEFENRVPYRVTISVDGAVVWNRTIHGAEGYRLTVEEDGTVVVRDHIEA